MGKRESAIILTLYTSVIIDDEPARVCIIGGKARILFASCGFTIPVTGKHYSVDCVVRAYKEQIKQIKKLLKNQPDGGEHATWESPEGENIAAALGLPDDGEPPHSNYPQCFAPITEDELDRLTDGCTLVEDLGGHGDD